MNKSELKEMDLVLLRDKTLCSILFSKPYNQFCLFGYNLECKEMISDYSDDLSYKDNKRKDIVGVIRGETLWYQLNIMSKYKDVMLREADPEFLFMDKTIKWTWKLDNYEEVSNKKLSDMIYCSDNLDTDIAKDYYFYGKEIKDEIIKLYKATYIIWEGFIKIKDINYLMDHYLMDNFTLADDKKYIMYMKNNVIIIKKIGEGDAESKKKN